MQVVEERVEYPESARLDPSLPSADLTFRLPLVTLAAKAWGTDTGDDRVLCIHGWMDNSSTWRPLVKRILAHSPKPLYFVCLELAGHGRSSHRTGSAYSLEEYVPEVESVIVDHLKWPRFSILCHSMGAAVSILLAAILPLRIERFVTVEGMGPPSAPSGSVVKQLQAAVKQNKEIHSRPQKVYASLEQAIASRRAANFSLSEEAARILILRGAKFVNDEKGQPTEKLSFLHDSLLRCKSLHRFTEEEIKEFLGAIACPVLAILTENGLRALIRNEKALEAWEYRKRAVKHFREIYLTGEGHQVHMDAPDKIYAAITEFLIAPLVNPARL